MNKRIVVLMMILVFAPMTVLATSDRGDMNQPVVVRQLQGQAQGQLQGQQQGINAPITNNIGINTPDRVITSSNMDTLDIPMYQNGRVSNWNDWLEIPIAGATYLKKGEVVTKVLKVVSGIPGWRVRIEDVLSKIIDNKIDGPKVRYFILQKGAVTSGGINLLSAASVPMGSGIGSGAAPLGYTESVQNPQYVITFVEIQ
jgi:hypothetical protein